MVIRVHDSKKCILVNTSTGKHLMVAVLSAICFVLVIINQNKLLDICTTINMFPKLVFAVLLILRFFLSYTAITTFGEWIIYRNSKIIFYSVPFSEAAKEKFLESHIIIETDFENRSVLCIDQICENKYRIFTKYQYLSYNLFNHAVQNVIERKRDKSDKVENGGNVNE